VDTSDLDDLLSSLREVAAATPDPDDDDVTGGYYPDDEDDDEADKEDGEDHDGENEDDFSKRSSRIFRTECLLHGLTEEAEEKQDTDFRLQLMRRAAVKKPIAKPLSNLELKRNKLFDLRMKNNALQQELATEKQIALQAEHIEKARLALSIINGAAERKREKKAYNRRMALGSARICPEVSYFWREQAQAAFNSKKL
jgi:hypothetical protein